jgi:hypothetical protein
MVDPVVGKGLLYATVVFVDPSEDRNEDPSRESDQTRHYAERYAGHRLVPALPADDCRCSGRSFCKCPRAPLVRIERHLHHLRSSAQRQHHEIPIRTAGSKETLAHRRASRILSTSAGSDGSSWTAVSLSIQAQPGNIVRPVFLSFHNTPVQLQCDENTLRSPTR